jgi:hypothetical protein
MKLRKALLKGINPAASFEDGLRVQWKNRFDYLKKTPLLKQHALIKK